MLTVFQKVALAFPAYEQVLPSLNQLSEAILEYLPTETNTSRELIREVFDGSGKRVRPALYFLTCQMLGYSGPHLYQIAAVTEYVHTASLLHDDVVDNSSIRRNKPTVRMKWGDQASVLVGDLIYARASELMAATGKLEIVTTFAQAIRQMSEGELIQLEEIFNPNITRDRYFRIIAYKTAVLLSAACRSAAILADCSDEQKNALSDFGYNLGIAFQLLDDTLDYNSTDSNYGKKSFADLHEGKITLPLILLREKSPLQTWEKVRRAVLDQSENNHQLISDLLISHNILELCRDEAESYTQTALACLNLFDNSKEKKYLRDLATALLERAF